MNTENSLKLGQLKPLYLTKSISLAAVAAELAVTERHARRVLNGSGITRVAYNRIPEGTREFVLELKRDCPDKNCQWLSELVSDQLCQSISRSSVWRILKSSGLLEKERPKRIARSRFEANACGDLVQMDTTWGYWWGGAKLCLILLLDDYSRTILHGQWVEADTALANMEAIRSTVEKYGCFKVLYTDNASFFKVIRHNKSSYQTHSQEEYESVITKACREIGITHITHKPYQPQSKGKIERIFRFIQERFVTTLDPDMTLSDINSYFDWWSTNYNQTHKNRTTLCTPKERFNPEGFTPLPAERNLDDIFCWKYTRKVDSCNSFSFEGKTYIIPKEKCMVAYKVDLHVIPNNQIRVWHNDKFICQLNYQTN